MKKIRLAVCDDFKEMRDYIEFFCQKEEDVECVATAGSGEECIAMVEKYKPDILLLDIQMETDDAGVTVLPTLLELHPKMKVIILTAHLEDDYVFAAFAMGASDYLLKSLSFDEMLVTIRGVAEGDNTVRTEVAQILAENSIKMRSSLLYMIDILVKLSPSEYEILKDVYDGMSYAEIAKKRFVSVSTIKNQALRIMKKFGIHSMKNFVEELRELKIFNLIPNKHK